MKILVLGGAGYIGSHTVYELIDAGEEVVIIWKQDILRLFIQKQSFTKET